MQVKLSKLEGHGKKNAMIGIVCVLEQIKVLSISIKNYNNLNIILGMYKFEL